MQNGFFPPPRVPHSGFQMAPCLRKSLKKLGKANKSSRKSKKYQGSKGGLSKFPLDFMGVRAYTHFMTPVQRSPQARDRKMVLDCRDLDFQGAGEGVIQSVIALVTSCPQPYAMNVYLPSSAPEVRRLQFALQGLGCAVFRVTKCLPERY